jgi:RHS repeat-associated protein
VYGEGLVSQIDASGDSHYYHFDPTGHTLALTDAAGGVSDKYAYAPYGFTTEEGLTVNPFKYVGRYGVMDDGNGLHYMRARYYKEAIKRFVSLDGLHGDVLSPQSLNRYAYVLGNPVMGIDPSGYETEEDSSFKKISPLIGMSLSIPETFYANHKVFLEKGGVFSNFIKKQKVFITGDNLLSKLKSAITNYTKYILCNKGYVSSLK